ncbi:XrtA/PEP-CTERM system histidine kinase PrsK [Fundidesulfovibrio terrae]|uniref:XrtA/PEP-CTERM system histidine kinase PrsK n=1 Tax=Fundidesulfovibrio terrae TaxID=2922866 RepID=UPI001FAEA94C|nr:XrtA/PEP-CTERM system histidine kinase PrsK [Fundidesulfovibrio terrae]
MSPGPVQTVLLLLCTGLSVALAASLFLKPGMGYVRWYVIAGVAASLCLDALGVWGLPGDSGLAWTGPYMAVELTGAVTWMLFSRRYARPKEQSLSPALSWFAVAAIGTAAGICAAPAGILAVRAAAQNGPVFFLSAPGFLVRCATLTVLIMSLTALEATLVNSVHGQRWRIKFTILGCFSILGSHLFTLSLGLLYHTLDTSLAPARQTGFAIGTAFLLYSSLFRGGEAPVAVSKRLARTSVVLFGAGAYLLFLGALGLAMSLTGSAGNRALLLALGIVSGVGLLTLMLSERFRRKCTRLLQHYFYKEKYDYRTQWMSFTNRISSVRSRDGLYQAVLLGFCETFGMGGAVLYLKEPGGQAMVPATVWELDHIIPPRLDSKDGLVRRLQDGLAAVDIRQGISSASEQTAAFLSESQASFAVPLLQGESLEGLILMLKPIDETEEFNQEDFDLMEALGSQANAAILNLRLAELLTQARDMEVMGKVSTFIVHDLKNLVYTLSLIVDNAKRYIQDPAFQQDMLKGLENTVSKMHVLISQLRQLPTRENLSMETADLKQLVKETFKHASLDALVFDGDTVAAEVDRSQLQKVILNLVLNAREASPAGETVRVETGFDTTPYIKVIDNGPGMSDRFISESLFQPFKTTKSKGMGIGLYQCKQIVEAHGGTIEVSSAPGVGSEFTVRLPAPDAATQLEGA